MSEFNKRKRTSSSPNEYNPSKNLRIRTSPISTASTITDDETNRDIINALAEYDEDNPRPETPPPTFDEFVAEAQREPEVRRTTESTLIASPERRPVTTTTPLQMEEESDMPFGLEDLEEGYTPRATNKGGKRRSKKRNCRKSMKRMSKKCRRGKGGRKSRKI